MPQVGVERAQVERVGPDGALAELLNPIFEPVQVGEEHRRHRDPAHPRDHDVAIDLALQDEVRDRERLLPSLKPVGVSMDFAERPRAVTSKRGRPLHHVPGARLIGEILAQPHVHEVVGGRLMRTDHDDRRAPEADDVVQESLGIEAAVVDGFPGRASLGRLVDGLGFETEHRPGGEQRDDGHQGPAGALIGLAGVGAREIGHVGFSLEGGMPGPRRRGPGGSLAGPGVPEGQGGIERLLIGGPPDASRGCEARGRIRRALGRWLNRGFSISRTAAMVV